MAQGTIGHGIRLQRASDATPAVFTDIGELKELNGPSLARDSVDVSHSLSPNRYREFIPGMLDAGEVSGVLALVPSGTQADAHQEVIDDLNTATLRQYRILYPDANVYWLFDGFFTSVDHATPIDDEMTLPFTIKVSGQPTLGEIV